MTPHLLDILRRLSHQGFLSGQDIGRELGLSRASVHNAVREAESLGLRIQAVRGRGYRLARAVSWLDSARIEERLAPLGVHVAVLDSLDSTNARLLREAQAGALHKRLLAAEWQESGRGRRGRVWLGGLGGSLTFSLLWRFNRTAGELSGLSLVVGAALARTLRNLGLSGAALKWPNDLQVNGAKLAGVLIELAGEVQGPSVAVIGVGVNVAGTESFRAELEQPVTDLAEQLGEVDRNRLLEEIVAQMVEHLERFDREGFSPFRLEWEAMHAQQNQMVELHTAAGERIPGQAVGVDAQGALLLAQESGVRRFHSGEVSLRRMT